MQNQKLPSYAYGLLIAQSLLEQMPDGLDFDEITKGINAGLNGEYETMDLETASAIFSQYHEEQTLKAGSAVKDAGEQFLAANKVRKDVNTTESGLQYEVLTKGNGLVSPRATDTVTVHYHGTLVDGKVFDSSVQRGTPATFGLNQVIRGWTEGLQLMKVGDKFRFFLPYDLAYGDRAAGQAIKPFSALIFDVELLGIG